MSPIDFRLLREGGPSCPSELQLDRLTAGELPDGARQKIEAHATGCEACRARLADKRAGFATVPDFDERVSLARLRSRLDARPATSPLQRWLRALGFGLAPALVVAALLLYLRPRPVESDGVRYKGGLRLRVHRLARDGGSDEVQSGAPLHAGDRIRFIVNLPAAGAVGIFDATHGTLTPAWPTDGTDPRRPAGPSQVLPGALELDADPAPETLYLVHCPAATATPVCRARDGEPVCPTGCGLARFVLSKVK